MALGTHVARNAKTAARRGLQSRRAQSVSDFREIRGVFCAGCGTEGEGDRVGYIARLVVIASEAKQSSFAQKRRKLDCFVAPLLAMTACSHLLASEATTSPAALSPLSLAPCAVEKKFGEVASPAKNSRPSTGAASTARAPAWPGRACE